jgi:phospholipid-binding lipoprotein MlaA
VVPAGSEARRRQVGERRSWRPPLAALCLAAGLSACATTQGSPTQDVFDPIEPVNRAVFGFNMFVDTWLLEPVARAYRFVTPEQARRSVANFLANLRTPVIFANDALQGERERAGITLGRFMINTSLGVAGLFDPATALGYPRHDEDFGQTLGAWGVAAGPYLMLPLLGPSNGRDTAGRVGDYFINPLNQCCITTDERLGLFGTSAVSEREANIELLDDLRANSIDLYATIRTIYAQKRAADIRNGRAPTDQEGYDDIFDEEGLDGP